MRQPAKRARVAGILSICLLALSALSAGGTLAAPSPLPAPALEALGPPPADSCIGTDACTGMSGNVGANSCNGTFACRDHTGNVGDNSCNGSYACDSGSANVGTKSCNGNLACYEDSGNIGDYSCNGVQACYFYNIPDLSIGDCAYNLVGLTPDECGQPDARIKRSGGKQLGNDIYNDTGAGQHISLNIYAGDFRRIYVTAQNDGLVQDVLSISVDAGSEPGFSIRWFIDRTDDEVTNAVETVLPAVLDPGETFRLRGRIEVSNAVPRGTQIERTVTVQSNVNPGDVDVVTFSVKRR